ncbi:hypothetical protein [Thalassomonas sp. RHCl1]|uniref:hypothetical protein n=1 Tax=Thalassomonas sp. RHCl1 TaxID=2995320 RepID=UPI00248B7211|nr:hypothetical protein [Thalassomonas sp. RHCl1]
MNDQQIIAQFKVVKRKYLLIKLCSLALVILGLAIQALELMESAWFYFSVLAFLVFNLGALNIYKCPKCSNPFLSSEPEGGFIDPPKNCKECGAKLEESAPNNFINKEK